MGHQVGDIALDRSTDHNSMLSEGRGAAAEIDTWLTHVPTRLPSAGGIKSRVTVSLVHDPPSGLNSLQIFANPPSKLAHELRTVEVRA